MESTMKTLIKFIKSLRLSQALTVFLAGSLLVVSTACSQGNIAQIDDNQSANSYISYTDNQRSTSETEAKAKALVDAAKSRQKDNLGDYADSITDRAQDKIEEAKREIPQSLRARKNEAVQDIKQRTETLKDNISNTTDEAKRVFDGAVDTAQDAVDDATQAAKNTAKELKGNFQDLLSITLVSTTLFNTECFFPLKKTPNCLGFSKYIPFISKG